jgi:2-succinyl-5-enolpyruvyl-6-hydroxy-3-cyclohexene-1-carboxylate synthase
MSLAEASLSCAAALVDALVNGGVGHACVSPGSRSTPLALALARDDRVRVHVHLDERSSGFFALGLAKALGRPVALACTSGTAAAEYLPAIVEASQSRVPLIALTADRPPKLRGTGANQTIDQAGLYGRYVRSSVEPPVPTSDRDTLAWREAGLHAVRATAGLPIGPAHVNCPFDEPLVPDGSAGWERVAIDPEPAADAWRDLATSQDVDSVADAIDGARGILVAGWHARDDVEGATELAGVLGWPLLAEPTSGLRLPGTSLAAGQALLSDVDWLDDHAPDVVLQIGATPTTRATQRLVAGATRRVVIDVHHLEPDPDGRADVRVRAQPLDVFRPLLGRPIGDDGELAPFGWRAEWQEADARARAALDAVLDDEEDANELRVARDLAAWIPDGGLLVVGNSTPVRDLDLAMAPRSGLRVLANRGASGIDGMVATALGVAASGRGPTFALLGDLTFLYDVGSLLWNTRRNIDAVLIVLRNGGGEIFSLLDQHVLPEHRELFTTPHGFDDFSDLCSVAGAGHEGVARSADLKPALARAVSAGGIHVVEVAIDPGRALALREELRAAIAGALADLRPGSR